jgi:uncharacterized protein (DUF2236 family)
MLVWVHCCLVESTISVLDRAGVGLTEDDAGRYVAEQLRTAALLGLDPADVPADLDALRSYFRRVRPRLRVTAAARADAEDALAEQEAEHSGDARPPWASVVGLAYAALPSWARRAYAMSDVPEAAELQGTAITVALQAVRASLRGSSDTVGTLGQTPLLPSARDRLAAPIRGVPTAEPEQTPEPEQEPEQGPDGPES